MAALEASRFLKHAHPSFLYISFLQKRVHYMKLLYTICNEESDLLNIVLIRNGKKLSVS